ncbi:DNA topoisomerase domain protein [Shigella boydii 4444-74]|uniref:DNA topoisomerase domain protein n=1 Tax=Shigella boydii 4444-74 TaxID=766140 RepID=I6F9D2_SHIBO|nr:DNA topoisomerase domain protein [Shigella boydii 4444-74]
MQQESREVLAAMARSDPALTPVLAQLDPGFVSRIWNDKKLRHTMPSFRPGRSLISGH